MSDDDSDEITMDHPTCNCPYCGSENPILTRKNYIYSYPIKFRTYGIFHGIFLWDNRLPADVEQVEIACTNTECEKQFYIQCWPYDPFNTNMKKNTPEKISNKKLLLEDLLDGAHRFFMTVFNRVPGVRITGKSIGDMVILNASLVAVLFFLFMIVPSLISGGIQKLFQDTFLFVTPLLFILLLTSFQRQIGIIRTSLLKYHSLPVSLHEKYPKWPDYHEFNDASLERFFFGHPSKNKLKKAIAPPYIEREKWAQLTSPPLVFGIGAVIIGIVFYHYFLPAGGFTFSEIITPESNPIIYTSILFNIGYLLFHAPFWFVIGTVVWLSLITPCFIYTISRNLPLRIEPLEDIGGPKILGDVLLKSNVSIVLLAVGFIFYVIRNDSILSLDPTFQYFNIFLLGLFSLAMVFGFLLPLYPIHEKLRQCKKDEIKDLIGQIRYEKIKAGTISPAETDLNLLRFRMIDQISAKKEWPFNFDTLAKIIFMTFIPLFQFGMSIRSFF